MIFSQPAGTGCGNDSWEMLAPVISYLTVFTFRTGNIQLDTDCDKISQS